MIHILLGFIVSICLLIISLVAKCFDKNNNKGSKITGGADSTALTPLQREVAREYSNLKLPRHKISFEEFCFPHKFKLQNPQKFIGEYMAPGSKCMNLLAMHKIGAGKTCSLLQATEQWVNKGKPLVIMPASLITNFLNEMRGPCCNWRYISKEEYKELKALKPSNPLYKEIIKRSNEKIHRAYDIMSYNKFVKKGIRLDPVFMAIDEAHNINSAEGTFYHAISKFVRDRPKMKLLCLTATPIYDNKEELISLLRLMRQDVTVDLLNKPEQLKNALNGLISVFHGAPKETFPKTTLHYEVCKMSKFQSRWYRAEVEGELKRTGSINLKEVSNNFYSKSRARSNVVYPQGLSGSDGLPKLTKTIIQNNLETYSCKFAKIVKKLKKGQLSFVYSNFIGFGGIKTFLKVLRANGFSDYRTNGPGRKFAVFSGAETPAEKNAVREIFNSPENIDGKLIQVVIGSPSAKEGISFYNVRQVHVIDPYWNYSRLEQIFGRASRFCSHRLLPKSQRTVDIYLYIGVTYDSGITKGNFMSKKEISPKYSVDGYILKLADKKRAENEKIINLMMNVAVDKLLFQVKQK